MTAGIPVKPYVDNPTVCTGQPLTARLEVTSYEDPDSPASAQADYQPTTHCEKQVFNPVLNLALTNTESDAAVRARPAVPGSRSSSGSPIRPPSCDRRR